MCAEMEFVKNKCRRRLRWKVFMVERATEAGEEAESLGGQVLRNGCHHGNVN